MSGAFHCVVRRKLVEATRALKPPERCFHLQVRYLRLALGAVVDENNLTKAQECCFVKTIAVQVWLRGVRVIPPYLSQERVAS